jgi:hypothetical protein
MTDANEQSIPSRGSRWSEVIERVAQDVIAALRADGFDDDDKDAAAETLREAICPSPTLTDEEREAIQRAIDSQQHRAAEVHSRSWNAAAIDDDCDTLRGLLERTK